MSKFPQLLILLMLAGQARAGLFLGEFSNHSITRSVQTITAIPEPGVFVALISGAALLLARRRR